MLFKCPNCGAGHPWFHAVTWTAITEPVRVGVEVGYVCDYCGRGTTDRTYEAKTTTMGTDIR